MAGLHPRQERGWLVGSFAAHVGASFAQILIQQHVYGYGDFFGYRDHGHQLAQLIESAPSLFLSPVVDLLLQREVDVPLEVVGAGSPTGSMSALAGLFFWAIGGSLYTITVCIASLAFLAKVLLFRTLADQFPEARLRMLVAALLVPSTVFWSAGLLKEAVAIIGLCLAVTGLARLLERRFGGAGLLFGAGAGVLVLFKPYILAALIVAAAVWVYATLAGRRGRALGPLHLMTGLLAAGLVAITAGRLFPEYSLDEVLGDAAALQLATLESRGGSSYEIGAAGDASLAAQAPYLPLALLSSLYRPFLFEATNLQIAVNAVETTVLLGLTLWLAFRPGLRWTLRELTASPTLLFFVTFVLVLGMGVGLSTTNLGTLSRYRMPLVPFLWATVLVLHGRALGAIRARTGPAEGGAADAPAAEAADGGGRPPGAVAASEAR